MSVETDADLGRAVVYYDTLGGVDDDAEVLEALGEIRHRLQRSIASQTRVKRPPERVFRPADVRRGAAPPAEVFRSINESDHPSDRSDERRVANERVSTFRSRWYTHPEQKQ